ncbi:MAG TPA: multidrug ABC transporter permease [Porphyromonadaceae bacterium]|nr:multidrug ABC transporter permease [Porphyromonadaceae bacterium]
MKYLLAFIQKEIWHILRDKQSMLILLLMPVIQMILFGFAITTEVKTTKLAVMHANQSNACASLVAKVSGNPYFDVIGTVANMDDVERLFRRNEAKAVLVFPDQYDRLLEQNKAQDKSTPLQLIVDAADPNETTLVINYLNSILISEGSVVAGSEQAFIHNENALVLPEIRMLYNPQMESAYLFVPGVMGLIFLLVCSLMTSVSIVKEKEMGTMEVLLVSPFKPVYIVISKVVPYFLLSMINLSTILLLAYFVLGIPYGGHLGLIFLSSIIYILLSLSLGVLISTVAPNQQVAMVISLMGLMLPTILLSGLIFPIQNMPMPLQIISNIVPARWYIASIRSVMIKGLDIVFIWQELLVMMGMLLLFVLVSVKRFKTRLE